MKPKLLDVVAMLEDLPEDNLKRGDMGTIVEIFNDGEGYEVEFVGDDGKTYGLITLSKDQFIVLSRVSAERIAA